MKQFFIAFFANLAALLFVLGAPMLLFMILIVASISASSNGQRIVSIERGSILVFDMSMNVTDSPRARLLQQHAQQRPRPGPDPEHDPASPRHRPEKGRQG